MKLSKIDLTSSLKCAKAATATLERLVNHPLRETEQERELLAFNFRNIADEIDPGTRRDLLAQLLRSVRS